MEPIVVSSATCMSHKPSICTHKALVTFNPKYTVVHLQQGPRHAMLYCIHDPPAYYTAAVCLLWSV